MHVWQSVLLVSATVTGTVLGPMSLVAEAQAPTTVTGGQAFLAQYCASCHARGDI